MDLLFFCFTEENKAGGKNQSDSLYRNIFKMETAELTSQAIGTCVHPFVCQQ